MSGMCDLVGNATLYGGMNYSFVPDRFNNPNSAISFNNGYLQAPPGIYFSGDFTITAWIYLKNHYTGQTILEFGNGNNSDNIVFQIDNAAVGSLRGFVIKSSTQYYMDTAIIVSNLNQWYYVAFTLSGNIGSIYVNGVLSKSSSLSKINSVARAVNFIGRNTYGDTTINAVYDEIKIYQGAMSAAAIQTDYTNSSSGNFLI